MRTLARLLASLAFIAALGVFAAFGALPIGTSLDLRFRSRPEVPAPVEAT